MARKLPFKAMRSPEPAVSIHISTVDKRVEVDDRVGGISLKRKRKPKDEVNPIGDNYVQFWADRGSR